MQRYYVCRHYIKWKGKLYKKDELLPENFTDHDRVRSIYSSRIARKEVVEEAPPSQPPQQPLSGQPTTPRPGSTAGAQVPEKGAEEAKPKFIFASTGTH